MTFEFTGVLLRGTDNQRTVSIAATTFSDALTQVTAKFPKLKPLLLDNNGQLLRAHRVVRNGEPVFHLDGAMPLGDDDRIEFQTAVVGG